MTCPIDSRRYRDLRSKEFFVGARSITCGSDTISACPQAEHPEDPGKKRTIMGNFNCIAASTQAAKFGAQAAFKSCAIRGFQRSTFLKYYRSEVTTA
jgi:hypothetical protein